MVPEIETHIRLCADCMEPAWDSLSPSLFAPPLLILSLKINKLKNFFKFYKYVWLQMLTRFIMIILQYIQISNRYIVYPKLISYMPITHLLKKKSIKDFK